jgi:hypothetical protein
LAHSASATARNIIRTGEQYRGIPYRWGGDTPREGFDCSGFTRYVFARHGVAIPRTSRQQATVGYRLPRSWRSLRPGDLVMFANAGGRINHVAIYAGNNRILHSTSSGGGVRYDDLGTERGRWFREHMVAARRVVSNGHSLVRALTSIDLQFDGSAGSSTRKYRRMKIWCSLAASFKRLKTFTWSESGCPPMVWMATRSPDWASASSSRASGNSDW